MRRGVQVLLPVAAIALVPLAMPDETTGGQGYGTGPDRLNVSVAEPGGPGASQQAAPAPGGR